MKKSFPSYAYWGLCGLLSIGILKVSGASSNLYAFSHSLDIHADDEAIKKKAQAEVKSACKYRADVIKEKEWKEERARKAKEHKERMEKVRQAQEDERKRRQEIQEIKNKALQKSIEAARGKK